MSSGTKQASSQKLYLLKFIHILHFDTEIELIYQYFTQIYNILFIFTEHWEYQLHPMKAKRNCTSGVGLSFNLSWIVYV